MSSLLILMGLAFLVVGPVLSIIALVRSRSVDSLRARVETLDAEVAELRRRLRVVSDATKDSQPAPVAPPTPPPVTKASQPPQPQPVPVVPPKPTLPVPPSAAAPPTRPAPKAPEPPPVPPTPPIDWERWIGIRGAAVLGAVVLALAGLLFFQYSIQHGLITPPMRVVLGLAVGIAAIVGSEVLRPRGYQHTPDALAGAGVVVLYAALWAGHALYHLIPMTVTFALMALVTVAAGLLAIRRASALVAVLGLIGGFATPLLLQSDRDRPIGLFGYVLLLDLGLLAVGRKARWPWLSVLGLAGTVLLQGLWIVARMGPERAVLGIVILGVFALLFAAAGFFGMESDKGTLRVSQAAGLLLPFLFSMYFASRADLGPHLWPVAILVAMLSAGASWVGKRQAMPLLPLPAALGGLGVFAVWLTRATDAAAFAWEAVAIAAGIAVIFHVFVERDPDRSGVDGPAPAAIVSALGFLILLVSGAARSTEVAPWPWLCGWLALSILLYRHASFTGREPLQLAAAIGTALGLSLQHLLHGAGPSFPKAALFFGVAIAVGAAAQAVAIVRHNASTGRFADHAAAAFAAIVGLSLANSPMLSPLPPIMGFGIALVLGVFVLLAAARSGAGMWSFGALAVTTLVTLAWSAGRTDLPAAGARTALVMMLVTLLVFVIWPFVAGRKLSADRNAWYAAALAGPLAFFPAKHLWALGFGRDAIGLLPVILGAISLAATAGARRNAFAKAEAKLSAIVWFAAVAISFTSIAIPLQLDKSWVTIGWAIEGVALIALWRRLDHPGLKWLALAHFAAVTFRLVPTAVLLDSYPRSAHRIVNWVLYTYLVPAAALFAGSRLLASKEVGRVRAWEIPLYGSGKPVGAVASAIAGIFVVFVWINLAIADWFADGPRLTLDFGHSPARDLTVSIAWILYALVLLGFGMARANIGLRWLSLSFLVVTIGKVFLYDLGELRDLYRVLSLVGLAMSLLLVSLLYQRFVFRRPAKEHP